MAAWIRPAGITILTLGSLATGDALNDLARGITEVHRHWWSSTPVPPP